MTGGYLGVMEAISKGAKSVGGHVNGVTTDQIGLQFKVQPNGYLDEIVNLRRLARPPAAYGGKCGWLSGDAGRDRHIARDRGNGVAWVRIPPSPLNQFKADHVGQAHAHPSALFLRN